jgi:hypothetical protein
MYPDRYTFADRVDTFADRYTFADSFILQNAITANAQEGLAVMRSVEVCIDVAWSDADSPWPLTTFAPYSPIAERGRPAFQPVTQQCEISSACEMSVLFCSRTARAPL